MKQFAIFLKIYFCITQLFAQSTNSMRSNNISKSNTSQTFISPSNSNFRYNGILHKVITEEYAELYRYSEDYLDNGMDGTINPLKARTQAGVSISFKTNSPIIRLMFDELENSVIKKRRFTVFKNDTLVYDKISDLAFTIANPSNDTVKWEIYLPHFSGVKFLGMVVEKNCSLLELPIEDKPIYMAVGNSITHGTMLKATINSFPYLIAKSLNFRHINLATGGSVISCETLRNFNDVTPELITILWGYNDVNNKPPIAEVILKYESLVNSLCSRFKEADIFCILQTYTTTKFGILNNRNTIESLRYLTLSVVEKLQKKYDNLYLIDGEKHVSSEEYLSDQVHLNLRGSKKLSAGIIDKYKSIKYK